MEKENKTVGYSCRHVLMFCLLFYYGTSMGQVFSCMPEELAGTARDIIGEEQVVFPFDKIVQLKVNDNFTATGTVISDNRILTCYHIFDIGEKIKKIEIVFRDTTVLLKKRDFVILDHPHRLDGSHINGKTDYDIALLCIKSKRMPVVSRFCSIADFNVIKTSLPDSLHFSGYSSCTAGVPNNAVSKKQDILRDSKLLSTQLNLVYDDKVVSFAAYVCEGQSGGPLWALIKDTVYIIGTMQGFVICEDLLPPYGNVAVLIDKERADWINANL